MTAIRAMSPFLRPLPPVAHRTPAYVAAVRGISREAAVALLVPQAPTAPRAQANDVVARSPEPCIFPWPYIPGAHDAPRRTGRMHITAALARYRTSKMEPTLEEKDAWAQANIIIDAVCAAWPTTRGVLEGMRRSREAAWPRQCAMAMIRGCRPQLSTVLTGTLFGGRDHTTVMHAERAHDDRMRGDASYATKVAGVVRFMATGKLPEPLAPKPRRPIGGVARFDPTEALRLQRDGGRTYSEIAEAMGCSKGAVGRFIKVARAAEAAVTLANNSVGGAAGA
jgi:hypothetical protein